MSAPDPLFTLLARNGALETVTVIERRDRDVTVRTSRGAQPARVALSCLVAPEPGDVVLLGQSASGAHVLAVLDRVGDAPLELRVEGDASLRASGRLDVSAGDALHLGAERVEIAGREGRAIFGELEVVATAVHTVAQRARSVVSRLEGLFDDVTARMRTSHREVEGRDVTRAGDLELRVEGVFSARGRHATIVAEELVRFDGEQIQMG